MITRTYAVLGMACSRCEQTISEEVSRIGGVDAVTVDAVSDTVTIGSRAGIEESAVRRAVEQAGYEFDGPSDQAGSQA